MMKNLMIGFFLPLLLSCGGSDPGSQGDAVGSDRPFFGDPVFNYGSSAEGVTVVRNSYHLHEFDWNAEWPYKSYDEFREKTEEAKSEYDRMLKALIPLLEPIYTARVNGSISSNPERAFVVRNFVGQYERAIVTRDDSGNIVDIDPGDGDTDIGFYYDVPGGGEVVIYIRENSLKIGDVLSGYGIEWTVFYTSIYGPLEFCVGNAMWRVTNGSNACIGRVEAEDYAEKYALMDHFIIASAQIRTGIIE